jgi:hypothetical protein
VENQRTNRELVLNAALLIAAICLVVLAVNRLWPRSINSASLNGPKPGQVIALSNAPGPKVIAVLQIGCHFCDESMPYYKSLTALCSENGVPLIFVMPQPADEASLHLRNAGIEGQDVRQVSMASVHTSATPTLVLVDGNNQVVESWVGKLTSEDQAALASALTAAVKSSHETARPE